MGCLIIVTILYADEQCSAQEWTLRHWQRTSAVQCWHNQPLVDKMIPIYFNDPSIGSSEFDRVSQIFIQDKARKTSDSGSRDLYSIARSHASINCPSKLPYIAILVDLGLEKSQLEVTFPEKGSSQDLRIYAAAVDATTFPFLADIPALLSSLQTFVRLQQLPTNRPLGQYLQNQMKYGSTAMESHMKWERGSVVPSSV